MANRQWGKEENILPIKKSCVPVLREFLKTLERLEIAEGEVITRHMDNVYKVFIKVKESPDKKHKLFMSYVGHIDLHL
jgi:hypothetical protein